MRQTHAAPLIPVAHLPHLAYAFASVPPASLPTDPCQPLSFSAFMNRSSASQFDNLIFRDAPSPFASALTSAPEQAAHPAEPTGAAAPLATYFSPAVILPPPCENILPETCLSDNGFAPVLSTIPFIFCPDGTILKVNRSSHDRRTFIHAHIILLPNEPPFLGFGFAPTSGRPVRFLLDTGAGITVVEKSISDILLNPTPSAPIRVVGGSTVTSLGGGTMPFRYLSSPSLSPILHAFFGSLSKISPDSSNGLSPLPFLASPSASIWRYLALG